MRVTAAKASCSITSLRDISLAWAVQVDGKKLNFVPKSGNNPYMQNVVIVVVCNNSYEA